MNKGIKLATGDIIATLNSDDFYPDSTTISTIVKFIEKHNIDAAYGDLVYVDRKDTSKEVRLWQTGKYVPGAFLTGWVPPHPVFFCHKQIYEKYGLFKEYLKIAADFELMLRFIQKYGIKVAYLPQILVKMRTGGKANVMAGIIRGNMEILKAFRINGYGIPPSYFLNKPIRKLKQLRIFNGLGSNKKKTNEN